ncbi:Obg family GTPase CgtA [Candidatus Zinderia endosymbiont of Aphrophora alni]|uniref:Obg family GTPase CgtA n=1 Tax=Candidatus Zinderia endosymbiont of Aphrophora alni TaxID=3077951 RepID=UPI0030CFE31D
MKFIDEIKIKIFAGNGGDGLSSFCKEKFRPLGGPDGGNGGNGSNIWGIADKNLNTLINYQYKKIYKGKNGENGKKSKQTGKNAKNIFLKFPLGTLITDIKLNKLLIDLTKNKQKILLAKGGKGGLGNSNFKTSINRSPRKKTLGKIGEQKELYLELKILANIGLIGMPNSGKSTLISNITNAKPKISNYPFTTLYPNLGTINYKKKKIIIADIPGLIKGAYKGYGLGIKFLRHLQRTNLLLHIIDIGSYINEVNILKNIKIILNELKKFNKLLYNKPIWLILNKIDLISKEKLNKIYNIIINKFKTRFPIYKISALKKNKCYFLVSKIYKYIFK